MCVISYLYGFIADNPTHLVDISKSIKLSGYKVWNLNCLIVSLSIFLTDCVIAQSLSFMRFDRCPELNLLHICSSAAPKALELISIIKPVS
jgi:hypothetical protein